MEGLHFKKLMVVLVAVALLLLAASVSISSRFTGVSEAPAALQQDE